MSVTLMEAMRASLLRAAQYNVGDANPPAAVLWADSNTQWKPLVELLRPLMPHLLTLGEYSPQQATGPAIWLRCVIEPKTRAEHFPDIQWEDGFVPIIYMPGVSRQQLRAVEDCPQELRPLVELQYRGTIWNQRNGRDWSIEAFLVSNDGGLGLDIAGDAATKRAMLGSLSQLATTPIESLRGKRLEGEDFNMLMVGDPVRELLHWLSNPQATRSEWDNERWAAFCEQCRETYGFDPEADGELIGASKLGDPEGPWLGVWRRFEESPEAYPGIEGLLRKAMPATLLLKPEYWPSAAEEDENQLREKLRKLADLPAHEAREQLVHFENSHGPRRGWVWAKLNMCPLVFALKHLSTLAEVTSSATGGHSSSEMSEEYRESGYRADDAVLQAIAAVQRSEDREVVGGAIRSVYLPWLEDSATRLQEALLREDLNPIDANLQIELDPGDCLLFVDGLRYDVGERLAMIAEERGAETLRSWRWAALPTVTATAKPAVTLVANLVSNRSTLMKDFSPQYGADKKSLTTGKIEGLLRERGIEKVDGLLSAPALVESVAWAECAQIDKLGHDLALGLADQINPQLEQILERVFSLLSAGWKRVRVVTDHGWLLMPKGLDKSSLPKYLTESRWARCAVINDTSYVDVPVFGWSWNQNERFAAAPGACAFRANVVYAHGGVSLQECVIPDLTISRPSQSSRAVAHIEGITWAGLRCKVQVASADISGLVADVRMRPNDTLSSLTTPKPLDDEGRVSLLIEDEGLISSAACVVILDSSGQLVAQESTIIGGER